MRADVLNLGLVPYREAWELQRTVAAGVATGELPDTVILLEHPPVITLGRRTDEGELHIPRGAAVEVVETDRGGKSTYHGPGQLICYPIFDLTRQTRIEGLTGIWLERPPRKIASIGIHISKWITTHGYALNVDLDPAPFTEWITACGIEDAQFTTMARELGRPVAVDAVRSAAVAALADIFNLHFEAQPAHAELAASS